MTRETLTELDKMLRLFPGHREIKVNKDQFSDLLRIARESLWIDVNDALPEPRIHVLVTDGQFVEEAYHLACPNHWRTIGINVACINPVTHWRRLPYVPVSRTAETVTSDSGVL